MAASLLIVILLGAVIAFFVRFFIALYEESRSLRIGRVKMVHAGYKVLSRKPERHAGSQLDG